MLIVSQKYYLVWDWEHQFLRQLEISASLPRICSAPFASRARYCLYKRLRPLEKDVWPFSQLSKIFLDPQKRIWTSGLHKIFPQCLAFGVVNGVSKGRGETTT